MIKVIISGGGTGGHVFPAIAIADALKHKDRTIDILFIGAKGRLEMDKVPAAGYRIEGLTISGFQRRLTWKNLMFPFKLAGSLVKAASVIARFRPDVVVGVGGYASGPTLRMAIMRGIPTLIQEQNSYPGVTNRLLAGKANTICVAYQGMEKYFPREKIILTGNPIRKDLSVRSEFVHEAKTHFGLTGGKKTILVIGGSLGAGTINKAILAFLKNEFDPDTMQLLWQTGKAHFATLNASLGALKANFADRLTAVRFLSFIDRMDLAYAAADLIVSRAGAIAISELCVAGKPAILIPSPNVAEDHQTRNAEALVSAGAALMVRDAEATGILGQTITMTLQDEALVGGLSRNIQKLAIPDAAGRIAEEVLKLTGSKNQS